MYFFFFVIFQSIKTSARMAKTVSVVEVIPLAKSAIHKAPSVSPDEIVLPSNPSVTLTKVSVYFITTFYSKFTFSIFRVLHFASLHFVTILTDIKSYNVACIILDCILICNLRSPTAVHPRMKLSEI